MKCEYCKQEHDGSYGSGRFCNIKCSHGFSTKLKRKEINKKVSKSLIKTKILFLIICKECCNETYSPIPTTQFCNASCRSSYNNRHRKIKSTTRIKLSDAMKNLYKSGDRTIKGGRTKWYTIDTSIGQIKVQGTYELDAVKILENWKKNNTIKDWSYTSDKISYMGFDGASHTYLLDFKVYNNDNTYYYLEIKGYKRAVDTLKWNEMKKLQYPFQVWFKKDIDNNLIKLIEIK